MILTPKVRKSLDIATRLVIAALSLSYIFYRIYALPAGQVNTFFESVLNGKNVIYISAALVFLMVINWGIESQKWRLLISQAEKVSFVTSYEAVLGGLAVSIFTPNRVGEFLGRVFILKKTDPLKAILLTIVGSFSQLLVTVVFGTVAYLFFAPGYLSTLMYDSTWLVTGFSFTLVTMSIFSVFVFFNISALHRISILIPEQYSKRIRSSIDAMADCPKPLLLKTVSLSALRYLVFSTQFYLATVIMGLNFTAVQCIMVIPVVYLVLAAIPTVALTELGVRGSVSVFLFGLMAGSGVLDTEASLAVVSASTLIWLLNIAVPSLAGVLVIFRLKFFRR
ncbi:MAG: lysylphosphatidylglycerol synthase domain-containing protein [Bacteroidales bacterium]|nr:lysylphosphatidylglycerol synthase domain-containing protein [Bacteroidales bacterium]